MRNTVIATISCLAAVVNSADAESQLDLPSIPSSSHWDVVNANGIWPYRVYKSSNSTPPNMTITGNGKPLADGYIFITPNSINGNGAAEQNGNFIMTSTSDLVYAMSIPGSTDFRKQVYNGKSYLTYWTGYNTNGANVGHGYGEVAFVDQSYNNSITVDPKLAINPLVAGIDEFVDIHEHQLTPRNTILLTAYNNTPFDISSVPNGPKTGGWIVDSLVYEVDIATQKVLFSWKASDHVNLLDSKQPIANGSGTKSSPWDFFHVNSIDLVGDNYLINSRHYWTFYLVSPAGKTIFSVQGEDGGSFGTLPANGKFRWQHFVRGHNLTNSSVDISIFDNHNAMGAFNGSGVTKQLVYHLELPAQKSYVPKLTRRILTPSDPLYVDSQGSYISDLSNGNQFVGFGQLALAREYGPATDGSDLRWQAQFGGLNKVQSYRGFKDTWHATPAAWDPSLVVQNGTAYVSWNGATDVEQYCVYTGNSKTTLKAVGSAVKKGFETAFKVPGTAKYVQVAALQGGKEVRRSNLVAV